MGKKNQNKLFVMAVPNADVHELSPDGQFITGHGQLRRVVGKTYNAATDEWEINPKGVLVHYHPEYVRHLKEKSLLPVNLETALAAGVAWKSSSDKG